MLATGMHGNFLDDILVEGGDLGGHGYVVAVSNPQSPICSLSTSI